jgi:hypothetical protein
MSAISSCIVHMLYFSAVAVKAEKKYDGPE